MKTLDVDNGETNILLGNGDLTCFIRLWLGSMVLLSVNMSGYICGSCTNLTITYTYDGGAHDHQGPTRDATTCSTTSLLLSTNESQSAVEVSVHYPVLQASDY